MFAHVAKKFPFFGGNILTRALRWATNKYILHPHILYFFRRSFYHCPPIYAVVLSFRPKVFAFLIRATSDDIALDFIIIKIFVENYEGPHAVFPISTHFFFLSLPL